MSAIKPDELIKEVDTWTATQVRNELAEWQKAPFNALNIIEVWNNSKYGPLGSIASQGLYRHQDDWAHDDNKWAYMKGFSASYDAKRSFGVLPQDAKAIRDALMASLLSLHWKIKDLGKLLERSEDKEVKLDIQNQIDKLDLQHEVMTQQIVDCFLNEVRAERRFETIQINSDWYQTLKPEAIEAIERARARSQEVVLAAAELLSHGSELLDEPLRWYQSLFIRFWLWGYRRFMASASAKPRPVSVLPANPSPEADEAIEQIEQIDHQRVKV